MPRAPARPTCSTISGRRSTSARAVTAAASTGPTPQTSVSTPRRYESSRSVAATTSITRDRNRAGASARRQLHTGFRDELATNLAGRVLRGVHVHVGAVLLDRVQERRGNRRCPGHAGRARGAERDDDVAGLAPEAGMDVRLGRRAGELRERQLPRQRRAVEPAGEGSVCRLILHDLLRNLLA